ncbi:phosphoadenosine phosphosulfate reductase [Roseovarius sp. 2305UL8-3]|uniref:phosphoadenosine phosphosulfate reductase n=1 Tax=Roseovarius conchicola TaxID=3121636 RepID=UPI003528040C
MQDHSQMFATPLDGQSWLDWVQSTTDIIGENGSVEHLGPRHAALFLKKKPQTLLVSFEAHHRIEDVSDTAHPLGWQMANALGWSHLCLASETDTWFRDNRVYAYFDRLIDEGFFDAYEQVVFYGAGACGYAACAFSVAAPGARVLALCPQATLDPRVSEWDDRFLSMRRVAFDDRYGYAPDMLDGAEHAFVLYDPEVELDAMHAALFTRPNVTKYRMRHQGPRIDSALVQMNILMRMLAQLSVGKLNTLSLSRLYRARRDYASYQFNLLKCTTRDDRHHLTKLLAEVVLSKRNSPPFHKALARAKNSLAAQASLQAEAADRG